MNLQYCLSFKARNRLWVHTAKVPVSRTARSPPGFAMLRGVFETMKRDMDNFLWLAHREHKYYNDWSSGIGRGKSIGLTEGILLPAESNRSRPRWPGDWKVQEESSPTCSWSLLPSTSCDTRTPSFPRSSDLSHPPVKSQTEKSALHMAYMCARMREWRRVYVHVGACTCL